jgi:hypothetical protein
MPSFFQGIPKRSLDREAVVAFDGWFVSQENPRSFAKAAPFANLEMLHAEHSATRQYTQYLGRHHNLLVIAPCPSSDHISRSASSCFAFETS